MKSVVTRWRTDPWARGTYSFVPPGSSGRDYDEISMPLFGGEVEKAQVDAVASTSRGRGSTGSSSNRGSKKTSGTLSSLSSVGTSSRSSKKAKRYRVFFAGEATNRYFPATAHGAFSERRTATSTLHFR